jgi:hypothetical protein
MISKRRIETVKVLVTSSVVSLHPIHLAVLEELDNAYKSARVRLLNRKRILQVLHMTRALDSSLKTFVDHHGCGGQAHNLGGYLIALATHGYIDDAERAYYQTRIVARRNIYMHEAGTFPPHDQEISDLLDDMSACLTRVFNL